jgi:arylformamidase
MKIHKDMIVYPGNPLPLIQKYTEIPKDKVNGSLITLGSHTGTHVDSKHHIFADGEKSDKLPLKSFFGKCKVLDLTHVPLKIHYQDLKKYNIEKGDIILLKTRNSQLGFNEFRKDFVHLMFDAAEYLVKIGVKTLGFDYLSVKKFRGDPKVHEILISNLTLFEGLNLSDVCEGEYVFAGLPIRIACDGAPARAILIEN